MDLINSKFEFQNKNYTYIEVLYQFQARLLQELLHQEIAQSSMQKIFRKTFGLDCSKKYFRTGYIIKKKILRLKIHYSTMTTFLTLGLRTALGFLTGTGSASGSAWS